MEDLLVMPRVADVIRAARGKPAGPDQDAPKGGRITA
jgi:hypothetical protein